MLITTGYELHPMLKDAGFTEMEMPDGQALYTRPNSYFPVQTDIYIELNSLREILIIEISLTDGAGTYIAQSGTMDSPEEWTVDLLKIFRLAKQEA